MPWAIINQSVNDMHAPMFNHNDCHTRFCFIGTESPTAFSSRLLIGIIKSKLYSSYENILKMTFGFYLTSQLTEGTRFLTEPIYIGNGVTIPHRIVFWSSCDTSPKTQHGYNAGLALVIDIGQSNKWPFLKWFTFIYIFRIDCVTKVSVDDLIKTKPLVWCHWHCSPTRWYKRHKEKSRKSFHKQESGLW